MVTVARIKTVLHTPPTRSGIRVVILTLEDETGLADVPMFPTRRNCMGPSSSLQTPWKDELAGQSLVAERIANLWEAIKELDIDTARPICRHWQDL